MINGLIFLWLDRNSIRYTVQLGIALLEPASARMSHIPSVAFCIFRSTRFTYFFSKPLLSLWIATDREDSFICNYEFPCLAICLSVSLSLKISNLHPHVKLDSKTFINIYFFQAIAYFLVVLIIRNFSLI